jgi:phosphoserine phosphatase
MERLMEIESGIARERRHLARAYDSLRGECDDDEFARRWRAVAAAWRFDELNELIRTHNEWYPVERDLPMDLRTRDYVLINGRSYRRRELDADWILEQFPAPPR